MKHHAAHLLIFVALVTSPVAAGDRTDVDAVLDAFHLAASEADEERYFSLLAPDAVFLGTDASERWTRDEFRKWAHPHFASGKGWTFVPRTRFVTLARAGDVAWFDEVVDNAKYGECRGSGVLQKSAAGWKIEQYNLTIPVPNELASDLVRMIRQRGEDEGVRNGGRNEKDR